MNWKLVLQLSLFGLAMGIATVFFIPSRVEPLFWLVILGISAYFIATRSSGRYFLHGLLVGVANGVWVTASHLLLFDRYVANHPRATAMMTSSPLAGAPRLMMALVGPVIGVVSGLVLGLFAIVAVKLVSARTRQSPYDSGSSGDVAPRGVAFSPDGATAYVTNQLSQNVGVINVASSQQVSTIFTPAGSPLVVRVSPDGSRLFVATASTTVYIIDTQSQQIIGSVQVGFLPNAFAVHPDGRIIYVSAAFGGTVSEVDMFTGTVLRTFTVGGIPQDMAVTRKGDRLYVGNEAGFLTEITLQSGQTTATIPLAGGAFGIGVTPDDGQAYVTIPSVGVVQIFTLNSRRLAQTLRVGGNPRRVGFSQLGRIGAIANLNGYVTFVR